MTDIFEHYQKEVKPTLIKELGIKNVMATPRLKKIVLNIGMGKEALENKKNLEEAAKQLAIISGQKPLVTKAHRSIATFKLRAGQPIGLKVTLRGKRMYDFFTKFVRIVLPRIRDFRGIEDKRLIKKEILRLDLRNRSYFRK